MGSPDTAAALLEIEEVFGLHGRRAFVRFQFELYGGDANWVPPLISEEVGALEVEKNPGLEGCDLRLWLAKRAGRVVGRVAGVINHRDNERRGLKAVRFVMIDFVDDLEVAKALLGRVEEWAAELGMELLEGPLGLTTFERSAVLVEGFDRLPTAVSSYNFPYYGEFIEACGFEKEVDYLEHRFKNPRELDPKYTKVAAYVLKKKGLRLLDLKSRKELLPYGAEIFQLINAAYADLYEFTPMSDLEIEALGKKFFRFIDPDFVKIVVDAEGVVVAFGGAVPSMSRLLQRLRGRKWRMVFVVLDKLLGRDENDTLDLYLIAVQPALRNAGLNAIVMQEMNKAASAAGLTWVETNGELETNSQVQSMWKAIEHETHKRRRLYSKRID